MCLFAEIEDGDRDATKVSKLVVFHVDYSIIGYIQYEDLSGVTRSQSFQGTLEIKRVEPECCSWRPSTGPAVVRHER